ncbi:MAG: ATP-binding protein [Chloroflexota bacterium]
MMRSLTVRWILTLLVTSLVGVFLVGLFAYRTTITQFDRLRLEQAQSAFVENVTAYYQTNQSWEGIQDWLLEKQSAFRTPYKTPQLFALADTNGKVVAGFGPFQNDQLIPADELQTGVSVLLDGQQIGTAILAVPPPDLDPRERGYISNTNQALLFGAVGAVSLALFLGIVLSRHFLRPLSELTSAITAMRQGDLNQQVQVRTRDELGTLAQTFNEMSAQIHHANQLRQQMTADIAHDLRTPLMVISGYLEALRDGTFEPTPERFDAMNRETTLLKRLVEDLRTLSLADAGELKLLRQSVQPQELLQQVKQAFEPIADEQHVALHVQTDSNLPELYVDRERMIQVLANLVSNALHYTSAGGSVTLSARQDQGKVQLAVKDTGSGIPEDKLPNIFERFYRIEESRSQNQGETGLGLAIAKSIVEAHQGTISAESQLGNGTAMTITLLPAAITSSA